MKCSSVEGGVATTVAVAGFRSTVFYLARVASRRKCICKTALFMHFFVQRTYIYVYAALSMNVNFTVVWFKYFHGKVWAF